MRMHLVRGTFWCALWLVTWKTEAAEPPASTPPQMGVYRWANAAANVEAFERWLGGPLVWAEDFVGGETWNNVAWPVWWLEGWSKWKQQKPGRRLILSIPLLPGPWDGSGPQQGDARGERVSLEDGAAGKYNPRFKTLAENLVTHRLGDTILRLGWEFNGGWYTWRAKGKEQAFAGYWRQIVRTMRSVPGTERLQFCWNPILGYQQFPSELAWPGDEFVDFVGVDVYDETWLKETYPWPADATEAQIAARRQKVWQEAILHGNHGLAFWSQFAREHRKPLAIPEWGVNNRVDMKEQHGGLDNVLFIEQMHRFMMDPANRVAFHCYFDVQAPDGHHQLSPGATGTERTEFPLAAAKFKELFGHQGGETGSAPTELILCGADEVFILALAPGAEPRTTWSWRATNSPEIPASLQRAFRSTDDCKPVAGGRQILVSSSSGAIALIERETRRALFYTAVPNAHSLALLPGGRIAAASSVAPAGNRLLLFDLATRQLLASDPLPSAHGVVWDDARTCLWALGDDQLRAYRLLDQPEGRCELRLDAQTTLPDRDGHDLSPIPDSTRLFLSTGRHAWTFDRATRQLRPHDLLADTPDVKSYSVHPLTGRIAYLQAEGTNWWAERIHFAHPSGELHLPGQRLYKARWQ